jgi:lipopolysaccharide export system protein LptA
MNTKIFLFLTLFIPLCVVNNAVARTDDGEKPIHITADTAELNEKSGVSIYRGDVKMVQGTTILHGDIITVYTANDEVEKMISVGNLATYEETTDDGDVVYAESEEMIYNSADKKIELFRRGKITQVGNVIRSDYILYLTEEGLIDTGTKKDRIEITIQPKAKNNAIK